MWLIVAVITEQTQDIEPMLVKSWASNIIYIIYIYINFTPHDAYKDNFASLKTDLISYT